MPQSLSENSLSSRDSKILSDLPAGRLEDMKIEEGYSESNATKSECFVAEILES